MKRSALALLLVLAAFRAFAATAEPTEPKRLAAPAAAKEPAGKQQPAEGGNVAQGTETRGTETQDTEASAVNGGQLGDHGSVTGKILSAQPEIVASLGRIEDAVDRIQMLLVLTALLAAGALSLGLWELRALRLLAAPPAVHGEVYQRTDLPLLSSLHSDTPESGSSKGAAERTEGKPVASTGTTGAPVLQSSERNAPEIMRSPSLGSEETTSPSMPQHHREIAGLLARLQKEVPRLAEGFFDRSLQERFLGEFNAPLRARLDRLRTYSEQAEDQIERWVELDLVATLDALAGFYSEAFEEGRHGRGSAKGLARELRAWLYDRLGPACRNEGWFAIDPVDPYETRFDPRVHHAVAGRDVDGAEGKIIAIKAIGRRDPKNGNVIHKAEVIVGR